MSEIDRTEMIKARYSCAVATDGNSFVLLAERSPKNLDQESQIATA